MKLFDRIKALGSNARSRAEQRKIRVAGDLAIVISKAGLKRKDVAQRLEITEAALSTRLNGTSNLTLESIGSICDVAGCDFDVVFRRINDPVALSFWELEEPLSDDQFSDVRVRKVDVDAWFSRFFKATGAPSYSVSNYAFAQSVEAANDCATSKIKHA